MRIRQVKPEFFKDGTVAKLSIAGRLTYIGLWMLADDAGWLRLDEPSIALELFGYETRARREKIVAAVVAELLELERIVAFECGHARIPTFRDHQRFAGSTKQVFTIEKEHGKCPRVPAVPGGEVPDAPPPDDTRGSPRVPAVVRIGSVRFGQSNARKRDDDEETEFQRRIPRNAVLS